MISLFHRIIERAREGFDVEPPQDLTNPYIETALFMVAGALIGGAGAGLFGSNNAPDQVVGNTQIYYPPSISKTIADDVSQPVAP